MDRVRLYFLIILTVIAAMLVLWFSFCMVCKCGCFQSCYFPPCASLHRRYFRIRFRLKNELRRLHRLLCCPKPHISPNGTVHGSNGSNGQPVPLPSCIKPPKPAPITPLPNLISRPYLLQASYNDSKVVIPPRPSKSIMPGPSLPGPSSSGVFLHPNWPGTSTSCSSSSSYSWNANVSPSVEHRVRF